MRNMNGDATLASDALQNGTASPAEARPRSPAAERLAGPGADAVPLRVTPAPAVNNLAAASQPLLPSLLSSPQVNR